MNRLPPPVITLIGLFAIYGLNLLLPQFRSGSLGGGLAASIFFTLGAGILAWSGQTFRKHKTTVNPLRPERATTLVTTGPYRFMRNPMYLALILFLWSGFTYVGNWTGIAVVLIILVYFDTVQIAAEEAAMSAKFGEDWTAYTARVRKWI